MGESEDRFVAVAEEEGGYCAYFNNLESASIFLEAIKNFHKFEGR